MPLSEVSLAHHTEKAKRENKILMFSFKKHFSCLFLLLTGVYVRQCYILFSFFFHGDLTGVDTVLTTHKQDLQYNITEWLAFLPLCLMIISVKLLLTLKASGTT